MKTGKYAFRGNTAHVGLGDISLKKQAQARAAFQRRAKRRAIRGAAVLTGCFLLSMLYLLPLFSLEKSASAESLHQNAQTVTSAAIKSTPEAPSSQIQNLAANFHAPTTARLRPTVLGYISPKRPRFFRAF